MTDFWNDSPVLRAKLERVANLMDQTVRSPRFPLRRSGGRDSAFERQDAETRPSSDWRRFRPQRRSSAHSIALQAIELLHVATLIHDDVLDEAELRRGLPTLHMKFGHKEAVLAGDWILSRCFRLASASAGRIMPKPSPAWWEPFAPRKSDRISPSFPIRRVNGSTFVL